MSAFSRLASALRSLPSWAARYIDNRLAAVENSVAGLSADGTFTMAAAAANKAVYLSAADTVALADADAGGKKLATGITIDAPTGTTAVVRFMGIATGVGTFTAGAPQYVSTTAGDLTETPPSTPNATPIAIAINTTDLLVLGPLGAVFDTLRSTSANLGASLISIQDALTLITATTVEGALAELAQFKADLGSIANGKGASKIAIEDAGSLFAAADVEAALAEGRLRRITVTVDYSADAFSGLAGGVKTFSKDFSGGALPANAKFVGFVASTFTGFDDAAHGTYSFEVGSTSDDNGVVSALNVAAGQSGFPKAGTLGVLGFSMAPLYAETLVAKLTSSVDLNTATAGAVTLDCFYAVRS